MNRGVKWDIETISLNAYEDVVSQIRTQQDTIKSSNFVFFGLYIWSIQYAKYIIELKTPTSILSFAGYNVTQNSIDELIILFPRVNHFIIGYAEEAVYQLVEGTENRKVIQHDNLTEFIGKVHYNQVLKVEQDISTVRTFSKLGCIYDCQFCAHRDNLKGQVVQLPLEGVIQELRVLNNTKIDKLNFIDPIFNYGDHYISILKWLIENKSQYQISLQVSTNPVNDQFLNLCEKLNCVLEIGVQDIHPIIKESVSRTQNTKKLESVIHELNKRKIRYELSFIIGLPYQTLEQIKENINWISQHTHTELCKVRFNQLMLLPGTKLYEMKRPYEYKEELINGIPYVCESKWLSSTELNFAMELAALLNANQKKCLDI